MQTRHLSYPQVTDKSDRNLLTASESLSSRPQPRTHPTSNKLSSQWLARSRNAWEPLPARTRKRSTSDKGRVCNQDPEVDAAERGSKERWVGVDGSPASRPDAALSSKGAVLLSVMYSDHLADYAC